jgi:hypothetical protein
MAEACPSLTIVLRLVRRMLERARADCLLPDHPMKVRAKELHAAYVGRFLVQPPDCSIPAYIDAFIRAYAAWHAHTGEDEC